MDRSTGFSAETIEVPSKVRLRRVARRLDIDRRDFSQWHSGERAVMAADHERLSLLVEIGDGPDDSASVPAVRRKFERGLGSSPAAVELTQELFSERSGRA
jgi:hypothetical protein